jgi:hypothetical protein
MKNIVLFGLSGSGKDTIGNHIASKYGYNIIRISKTLKYVVTEILGLSFDELEILKRKDPKIRSLHNEIGVLLDTYNHTLNRIGMLINGKAMDYDNIKFTDPKIVVDCRTLEWLNKFIEANYSCILLTRTTNEFSNYGDKTEQNIFLNGSLYSFLENLSPEYYKNIVIIDNNSTKDFVVNRVLLNIYGNFGIKIYTTNGSTETLLNMVDNYIQTENFK